MKSTVAHTRIQSPQHKSALVTNVKQATQLALDEAGWSGNTHANKSKVMVSENKKLEGDSGMRWTVDLAVIDCKEKPIAIIFCIDFSSNIDNLLNKAAAACQDLYSIDALIALVIRKGDKRPLAPTGYDKLFASAHVQIIQWNPKRALELAIDILHKLRRRHPRVHGKSIVQTAKSLAAKYPDLFIDNRQMPKKTDCLELLHLIKECDLHQNFGEIIKDALSQDGTCQSLVGTRLTSITDAKLESLLKEYLEWHR